MQKAHGQKLKAQKAISFNEEQKKLLVKVLNEVIIVGRLLRVSTIELHELASLTYNKL